VLGVVLIFAAAATHAQTCTTQARMSDSVRNDLSGAAMNLAQSIREGNAAKVQASIIAEFASDASFAPTAAVIRTTAPKLAGDTVHVTQIYELDARGRKPGDTSEADFSCALSGTTAETDFSISGLPPGLYGFAMVEAEGSRPWLLSFLLRQDGGVWKAGRLLSPRTHGCWPRWPVVLDDGTGRREGQGTLAYLGSLWRSGPAPASGELRHQHEPRSAARGADCGRAP